MIRLLLSALLLMIVSAATAQNGNVGIGTTNPLARLHVTDSVVLFSASGPVDANIGSSPLNGAGRRMMWWPGKAAFRTGYVNGLQWNTDSIGVYSFAAGVNTKAKGLNSVALNENTIASQQASFAAGYFTQATGIVATAFGQETIASGYSATSMGYQTTASGPYSTAIGQNSFANSNVSTAIGYLDTSTGHTSVTLGGGLYARSWGEVAVGCFNLNYTPAGFNSIASSDRAFSVGIGTGNNNRRNALTILKNGLLGIGITNPFSQLSNTSLNTIGADGNGGNPGSFSWAANQNGYAAQIYNEGASSNSNGLAVKVANSNALVLDLSQGPQEGGAYPLFNVRANGNVGIGTAIPLVKLDIIGGASNQVMRIAGGRGQSDNNGLLIIQDSSNNTAASPNNELVIFLNASNNIIGTISRNGNANSISFNTTSDTRLKTGIHPTRYGLKDLMNIQVSDYRYKGIANAAQQTGFLAQQLYKVYPEAVTKGNDADEKQPYLVDYSKLTPLLVKSVQELKAQVDALEKTVKMLQQEKQALQAENTRYNELAEQVLKLQQAVGIAPKTSDAKAAVK